MLKRLFIILYITVLCCGCVTVNDENFVQQPEQEDAVIEINEETVAEAADGSQDVVEENRCKRWGNNVLNFLKSIRPNPNYAYDPADWKRKPTAAEEYYARMEEERARRMSQYGETLRRQRQQRLAMAQNFARSLPQYTVPKYTPQKVEPFDVTKYLPQISLPKASGGPKIEAPEPFPMKNRVAQVAQRNAVLNAQSARIAQVNARNNISPVSVANTVANSNQPLYTKPLSKPSYQPQETYNRQPAPVKRLTAQQYYGANYRAYMGIPEKKPRLKMKKLVMPKPKKKKEIEMPELPKLKMPKKWTKPHAPRPPRPNPRKKVKIPTFDYY